jgi:ribonuclease-3
MIGPQFKCGPICIRSKQMSLENKIGYTFKDKKLLKTALSHSSYAHETKGQESNERIEYLGDAVLELVISEYLYSNYQKLTEGEMTKTRAYTVCEESLSKVANNYGFSDFLLVGGSEEAMGGRFRQSLLADAVEALIGAIYLDGGIEEVKNFIIPNLKNTIEEYIKEGNRDYKTQLQEKLQKNGDVKIEYNIIEENGPAHEKYFKVSVSCNGKVIGTGEGKSKKEAEMEAARIGLMKSE